MLCVPAYSSNCLCFTLATSPAASWPPEPCSGTHTSLWPLTPRSRLLASHSGCPCPALGPHAVLWMPMAHSGCSPCALAAHVMLQPLASCSCLLPNILVTHVFTFIGSWPSNHPESCCALAYAPRPPPYYLLCPSPSCTWSCVCMLLPSLLS